MKYDLNKAFFTTILEDYTYLMYIKRTLITISKPMLVLHTVFVSSDLMQ